MAYLSVWAKMQGPSVTATRAGRCAGAWVEAVHTHLVQLGVICTTDGKLDAEVRRFSACVVPALARRCFQYTGHSRESGRWVHLSASYTASLDATNEGPPASTAIGRVSTHKSSCRRCPPQTERDLTDQHSRRSSSACDHRRRAAHAQQPPLTPPTLEKTSLPSQQHRAQALLPRPAAIPPQELSLGCCAQPSDACVRRPSSRAHAVLGFLDH